jgi:fructuronate reductase
VLKASETIFAVDLEKVGLSELVISYFAQLIKGKGAIRETLYNLVK